MYHGQYHEDADLAPKRPDPSTIQLFRDTVGFSAIGSFMTGLFLSMTKKNKGKRFDVLEIKAQKINRMERLLKKFSLLFSLSRRIQFTYQFLSFLFIFYALLKFSYILYHIFNYQDYHYCHRKWVFLFKEK